MGHEEIPRVSNNIKRLSPEERRHNAEVRIENEKRLERLEQKKLSTYEKMTDLAESSGGQYFAVPTYDFNIGFKEEQDAQAFEKLCIESGLSVKMHGPTKPNWPPEYIPKEDIFCVCPWIELNDEL